MCRERKGLNLFLTGEIQSGKSTLLCRLVRELGVRVCGFRTGPVLAEGEVCGYVMEPFGAGEPSILMARRTDEGFEAIPITFDGLGCSLLGKALEGESDIVVMDEIGFFESGASAFHETVMDCLNSNKTVLGVLKKSDAPLPGMIRNCPDVRIVEVTLENRDELFPGLLHDLRRSLAGEKTGADGLPGSPNSHFSEDNDEA